MYLSSYLKHDRNFIEAHLEMQKSYQSTWNFPYLINSDFSNY